MRVALFITCLNDSLFPETGKATTHLLERLGCQVSFPLEQTCCGQMHLNGGYRAEAVPLAARFVRTFAEEPCDAIVCPSGSCAAMVRHHYRELISDDPRVSDRLDEVVSKVYELSEFIVDVLGRVDVGATYPHRVTYHPSCHTLRSLGVDDRPLRLLQNVRGLELVGLPGAASCCGFGGTFAVKNPDVSAAMLADKMQAILATRAEACTATDNSCLVHIGGGLTRNRAGVRAVHLAEILAATA